MGKRPQQSLSLSESIVRQIEEEAARRGVPKSRLVDQMLGAQLLAEGIGNSEHNSEEEPRIMAFLNHKGGVGKTTSAVNVASCLAEAGHRVLIIDLDEQGNSSRYLDEYDESPTALCIADVLFNPADGKKRLSLDNVIIETRFENLYLVPSNFRFSEPSTYMTGAGADSRLYYAIKDMEQMFDYIIIDCGPRLDITTTNAIIALDAGHENSFVVIVAKIEEFANEGVRRTAMMINKIAQERRVKPRKWAILQTVVEQRLNVYKESLKKLKSEMPNAEILRTRISKSSAIPESVLVHAPLNHYDPNAKPTIEYRLLTEEIEAMYE